MLTVPMERQEKHFDSIAAKYFRERQAETLLFLKDVMWRYFLSDKDYLKSVHSVLEPMCGFGEGKRIIEKNIKTDIVYEGFDFSQNIIDLAKKHDPELRVYKMDVLDMNARDKYDLVMIIGGLHHAYRSLDAILAKVHDALKAGGYFISYEPTNNMFLTRLVREKIYMANSLFDPETERAFDLLPLNDRFRQAQFRIVDQVYPGLLSYVLFYNPDAFPKLNVGGKGLVKILFNFDRLFFRNMVGRKLSFATLTLLKKDQ